eukprot:1147432-Pelagomonas_calceolata.AAC.7
MPEALNRKGAKDRMVSLAKDCTIDCQKCMQPYMLYIASLCKYKKKKDLVYSLHCIGKQHNSVEMCMHAGCAHWRRACLQTRACLQRGQGLQGG